MITKIEIDNFKSLVKFQLDLSQFNCLVGLNGAGKSTVLQGIDFVAQLMQGDVDNWLAARQWQATDLSSKLSKKSNITFAVHIEHQLHGSIIWSGGFNRSSLKCTQEAVVCNGDTLLKVDDGQYAIIASDGEEQKSSIVFDYQGSILSQFKLSMLCAVLVDLKSLLARLLSLDLISPQLLRSRAKASLGKLGLGGERLSAYLHELGDVGKQNLSDELKKVYSQLDGIDTRSLRAGWKQLEITEHFNGHSIKTSARHINDGLLRMMAIMSQISANNAFLLFDEIENGINPELVEYLIDVLVNADSQVLVTTHSPLVLNFLEDDVAKSSVIYLYKDSKGTTQAKRLFDIPSLAKKLELMGPGEAFVDTDLTQLYREIIDCLGD